VGITAERLAGVLEEAVHSLAALDADCLEKLERELSTETTDSLFIGRDARHGDAIRAVMATHRLLGSLLQSTKMNLNVLHTLRRRNAPGHNDTGDGQWVR
jgi:hypothetical protein